MKGNFHVQFLGEGVAATSPPYPTPGGPGERSPGATRPGTPVPGNSAKRFENRPVGLSTAVTGTRGPGVGLTV